jgi:ankyrin repeat protein
LHSAAHYGYLEIVKALIAKGADMNALSNTGASALGVARRKNHTAIVKYLQRRGAVDDGINWP